MSCELKGRLMEKTSARPVNMAGLVQLMTRTQATPREAIHDARRMVAELCHLLGSRYSDKILQGPGAELSPRLRQTLARLLAGDSEKQIARSLGVSQHTVHVYVKRLYLHYKVSSRGELLSRFVSNRRAY
jgi:DNA-binding CsgD family transcriptional regulator